MAGRVKKAPSLTPEEKERRRTLARIRFKAAGKLVIEFLYWMQVEEEEAVGDDILKNIQMMSRKKMFRSDLTMEERSILNTQAELRTEEDKQTLNRAIGGLKCFRRYPSNVKRQLAAVTYFCFYGPGRIIVKQGQVPNAMYFLLAGEISIKQRRFDKVLNDWVDDEKGPVGHGTMFGEQALLHNILRLATYITITPCELLMIKKDDFDLVLRDTVWKAWEAIQAILNTFTYFRNWNEVIKRECSIVARTKSYAPEETVLGDGVGFSDSVYFITKGSCYIIEHLILKVIIVNGKKKYSLYIAKEPEGSQPEEETRMRLSKIVEKYAEKTAHSGRESIKPLEIKHSNIGGKSNTNQDNVNHEKMVFLKQRQDTINMSAPPNFYLETRFVKVCDLTVGACFNIGETFVRRRVVASVPSNCLIVPRYWILRNNLDEVWTRVKKFLNTHIPSTRQIFKRFLQEQKFIEYRKSLVKEILTQRKIPNNNSIHNVPYSIRLQEGVDVDYDLEK